MTGLLVAAVLLSALVFLALQREWHRLARLGPRRVSVTLAADMRAFNEAMRQVGVSMAEIAARWERRPLRRVPPSRDAALLQELREQPVGWPPAELADGRPAMPLLWEGDQA